MAIIVSIIIIVAYCIYDRQRTNDKKRIKEINDRISDLDKRVASCLTDIGVIREDICSFVPLYGQSSDSND